MSRKHSRRGSANGSRRGIPDKQRARARLREQDPRHEAAMARVRAERAALDAEIARQAAAPAVGPTPGAEWASRVRVEERVQPDAQRPQPPASPYPYDGEPRGGWSIGAARRALRAGYTLEQVIRRTGVGYRWLNDIPVDAEGRGLPA